MTDLQPQGASPRPSRAEVLESLLSDLAAESTTLDAVVSDLPADDWARPTPAEGWTIAHQIAHLHWTDESSLTAIAGGEGFASLMKQAVADPTGFVDAEAERIASADPTVLLEAWRDGRGRLTDALRAVPDGEKIAWFGPPMSPASMVTARLMETWAHGHDVAEALGIELPRTARSRHVADLGYRTRGFAYLVRGKEAPTTPVRVELTGPDGETWAWGPENAEDRVTGEGYDFALLATRRRAREDVDVTAHGAAADEWLDIIQAFAGLPGPDPKPLGSRADVDSDLDSDFDSQARSIQEARSMHEAGGDA